MILIPEKTTFFRGVFILSLLTVLGIACEQSSFVFMKPHLLDSFDTNDLGWTVSKGGTKGYSATGGHPSGYIYGDDAGGPVWYFVAPENFVSETKTGYGKRISFDLKTIQNISSTLNYKRDIIITDNTISLTYKLPTPPDTTWTHYNTILDESSGWKKGSSVATKEEMQQVLQNLTDLRIRGDWDFTPRPVRGCLDNVSVW